MMKTVMRVVLVSLLALGASAETPPSKEEVLARFVEAVGGIHALDGREEVEYQGRMVQNLSWKEPTHREVPFIARASRAGEVRYAESRDWSALSSAPDDQPGRKLRWLLQPDFAARVEEFFPHLVFRGARSWDGSLHWVLESGSLDPTHYALYFNQETGLLTRIGFYDTLHDWREVDGVLFPHRFSCSRKGGHTTWEFDSLKSTAKQGNEKNHPRQGG